MKSSLFILTAMVVMLAGCGPPPAVTSEFVVGNVPARVAVPAAQSDQLSAATALARRQFSAAWAVFDESKPKSEIGKINRMAGAYRLKVSFNAFRAIDLAHYYSQLSDGAFDITIGPFRQAWGLDGVAADEEPGEEELAALRDLVGPQILQLSDQRDISLLVPGGKLAAGDLVFAYGVDLAAVELRRREMAPARMEWEDYTRVLPGTADAAPVLHRIPDPFTNGVFLGELDLAPDAAMAVVRLWEHTGQVGERKIPGVLDPRTGKPAEGTALVAVRGPTCTQGHALAMAMLVRGLDTGANLLTAFNEFEVLLVPDRQPIEIWATPGMARHLTLRADLVNRLRIWERPAAKTDETEPVEENQPEP